MPAKARRDEPVDESNEEPVDESNEEPVDEQPDGEDEHDDGGQDKPPARTGTPGRSVRAPAQLRAAADTGSGFILGLLLWGWVILPWLRGGNAEVKKVLKAKFLNKAPDGSWLP